MNIEKLKQLCTPVSEGLPEIKAGETIEVLMIFKYVSGKEELKKVYLKNDFYFGIEVVDFLFNRSQMWEFYTHWLDIEKLTTKSRAVELTTHITVDDIKSNLDKSYKEAGDNAYFANGFHYGMKFILDYINQNKERL